MQIYNCIRFLLNLKFNLEYANFLIESLTKSILSKKMSIIFPPLRMLINNTNSFQTKTPFITYVLFSAFSQIFKCKYNLSNYFFLVLRTSKTSFSAKHVTNYLFRSEIQNLIRFLFTTKFNLVNVKYNSHFLTNYLQSVLK